MRVNKGSHTDNGPIVITGAAGFVGRHLCDALLAGSCGAGEIVAAGPGAAPEDFTQFRWVPYDLFNSDAAATLIKSTRPRAVVHLAAIAAPLEARSDPDRAWRANFQAVRELADAVGEFAPAARLIFASSSEAYGRSFKEFPLPIDEDAPLRPTTVYGATKAAAETFLMQVANDGLDAVVFRAFNHTGPGQSPGYVVSAFSKQVAEIVSGRQAPRILVGNLSASRDFLDVRDVVRAYVNAIEIERFNMEDRILNLASGSPMKIETILRMLLVAANATIDVAVDPSRLRANDLPCASGSASRAARVLGWTPAIDMEDTLADLLDYWREKIVPCGT